MSRARSGHWEITAVVGAVLLAIWLAHPGQGWAAAAGASALVALALGIRSRRLGAIGVAVLTAAGAWGAFRTSRDVRQVEQNWDGDSTGVRWNLVEDAGAQLNAELANVFGEAARLAELGAVSDDSEPRSAFRQLARAVGSGGPESGVAVFDPMGRPWAWAGRHRLLASQFGSGLDARITPFYATLEAWRQGPTGLTAVGHVLLAADSAVPDREAALGVRFERETGVGLEFYPSGQGPILPDVFDYCLPACSDPVATPDTLFSVRLVPPSQGTHKLNLLADGGRWVARIAVLILAAIMVSGQMWARVLGVVTLAVVLSATSTGAELGLGALFSPAVYYAGLLGPFSSSGGALAASAVLALFGAVALWHARIKQHLLGLVGAAILIVVAPALLRMLASGITPPAEGVGLALWLEWEVLVMLASAAALLLAAALVRGRGANAPIWMGGVAIIWAAGAAALGLFVWEPETGWPAWYVYLWMPAIALAIQPASRVRVIVSIAAVAGTAAAVLTWGAEAQGRLLLAERDFDRLKQRGDPVAMGLLERLGEGFQEGPVPGDAASLYSRWSRSPLHGDRYPAVLTTWSGDGEVLARLELAALDRAIVAGLERQVAMAAVNRPSPEVEEVIRVPGVHYLLSVPYSDGSVVTVVLGPRTRAISPSTIGRFLRRERALPAPYVMSVYEPVTDLFVPASERLTWRRAGWTLESEERLVFPEGVRQVRVSVALGSGSGLLIRGVLVAVLDAALIALLWFFLEGLIGRFRVPEPIRELVTRRSYRARLGLGFAFFFVIPTVGFAAWIGTRLTGEAERSRDLLIRETLLDAAGTWRDVTVLREILARDLLMDLGTRLNADLFLYEGGQLREASAPVLNQLGVLDRFLPRSVHLALSEADELEVTADEEIAGRPTRVGYRLLSSVLSGQRAVLAAPRLVEDAALLRSERDVAFGLILVTLGGLGAAAALATVAARALANPVHALQHAAEQVGRGQMPSPFGQDVPGEFVPVVAAFEQMASDVNASRAAVEAQRQRTASVLRNVATGVVALDDQLTIVIANPRAEELLGRRLEVGKAIAVLSPDEWVPVWQWVRATAQGMAVAEPHEFTIGERQVRVQVARLRGAASGWVVALDDVTDLAHAVRVLAWGELARQIAHEIKNPLTPIRLGIQHLQRAYDMPRGNFADTLDRTGRQMLAEIERLDAIARAFARFGAPATAAEPLTELDVAVVARDAAALYTLGGGSAVRVEAEGEVRGSARRDELKEVLINLIENARAADATQVTVVVRSSDSGAVVTMHDDGKGIPPEDLPRIFEPQFSTTTSGSGLGLAICKRLVESWGGTISVHSAQGEGTTVIFSMEA